MVVKAIIERGALKGRLQEVQLLPKDGDYPGKELHHLLP
jgi:hypothetical protein